MSRLKQEVFDLLLRFVASAKRWGASVPLAACHLLNAKPLLEEKSFKQGNSCIEYKELPGVRTF
jgi:hypothetical protein